MPRAFDAFELALAAQVGFELGEHAQQRARPHWPENPG